MASEIQRSVEAIADRIGMPVSLTDAELNSLAFSPHSENLTDEVRRDSILLRSTAPWVREWFSSYGVGKSATAVRVEPHPDRETLSRWILPVRRHGVEHGLICILDPERKCTDETYELVRDLVDELAEIMYNDEADRLETARHLHDALVGGAAASSRALGYLERATKLTAETRVVVVTITGVAGATASRPPVEAPARVPRPSVPVLQCAVADHHAFVITHDAPVTSVVRRIVAVAESCCGQSVVGIGEQCTLIDAATSHEQARAAMSVAARLPHTPDVLSFADLGALRFLAGRADSDLASGIDPRARALLECDDPDLRDTVERYLESGCDAAATAATMNMHRGTLYYRLRKARAVTGMDLSNGAERLTLQLSLLADGLLRSPTRTGHEGPVRLLAL